MLKSVIIIAMMSLVHTEASALMQHLSVILVRDLLVNIVTTYALMPQCLHGFCQNIPQLSTEASSDTGSLLVLKVFIAFIARLCCSGTSMAASEQQSCSLQHGLLVLSKGFRYSGT